MSDEVRELRAALRELYEVGQRVLDDTVGGLDPLVELARALDHAEAVLEKGGATRT